MAGRFLADPLFLSVLLLSRLDYRDWKVGTRVAVGVVILALGLQAKNPPLIAGAGYGAHYPTIPSAMDRRAIADERGVYYPGTGLLAPRSNPDTPWARALREAEETRRTKIVGQSRGGIGFYGFHVGPEVHVIDQHGLADPLLARLPAKKTWRVGHYERELPDGYLLTAASGENRLVDPDLAAFYDPLSLIVRGELFRWDRLAAIWRAV